MARKIEVEIVGDSRSLERALGRASNSSQGFASKFSKVGKVVGLAALGVGAAAATGIGFAVKAAAEYEQSLNVFKAVTNASGDEMKRVGELAKKLGSDITLPGTSAKDAADAMTELAKGGLSVRDTMNAAKGVLQLSAAAQIENADAATITARALNSFSLRGEEAVRVADLLAATANASTAEIEDLAMGLAQASAVFKQGNQKIDDLTTALGLMANAGIAGSDAGTSLKTMMLSLLAPATSKAKDAITDLGVKLRDSHGQMLPLRDLIDQFSDKLGGLTDAQRDMALKTIFGTDALRAANVVLAGGVKKWDQMHGATTKGGEAAALAEAKMQGLQGAMEGFKSAVETLAISVGEIFLPLLTPAVTELSKFIGFLDKAASAKSPKIALRIIWTGIRGTISDLGEAIRKRILGTGGFKPVKLASGKIIEWEDERHMSLIDSIRNALLNMNWATVGARVGEGISKRIKITADFIGSVLKSASMFIEAHGDEFAELGAKMLLRIINKLLDPAFWLKNWKLILGIAVAMFPLGRLVGLGAKIAGRLISVLAKLLPAGFQKVGFRASQFLLEVLGRLPGRVQQIVLDLVVEATGILNRLINFFRGPLRAVLERVPFWLKGAFRVSFFLTFLETIRNGFSRLVDWFRDLPGRMGAAILGQAKRLKDAVFSLLRKALPSWAEDALGISSPSKVFAKIGTAIVDGLIIGMKSKAGDLKNAALDFLGGGIGRLGDIVGITGTSAQEQLISFAKGMGWPITSAYRPGDPGLHGQGKAIDVDAGGIAQNTQAFFALLSAFGSRINELFFDPIGWYIDQGRRKSGAIGDHMDHVHIGLFDKGGWLAPNSTTLAINRTPHWEPVGPPMAAGAGGRIVVPVYLDSRQIAEAVFDPMRNKAAQYQRTNGKAAF